MNASCELAFFSENRLLAEAAGASLVAAGAVSAYRHVRLAGQGEFFISIVDQPAIVVLDVGSLAVHEIHARIRRLAQELPAAVIVAVGDGKCIASVASCIEAGAATFVLANDAFDEFVATVRSLKQGQLRSGQAVVQLVLGRLRQLSDTKQIAAGEIDAGLTERELEVLELVERGLLNKEIAGRLQIALSTVKNHLHAIFEKLQVDGRRQAVRQAIAIGLLHDQSERVVA